MWSLFVPKIWELISTLNPSVVVGVLHGLSAIVKGSHSIYIPENSPDAFLANLLELGDKLSKEFTSEAAAANQFT